MKYQAQEVRGSVRRISGGGADNHRTDLVKALDSLCHPYEFNIRINFALCFKMKFILLEV